jgi:hypothetical protein
LRASRICLTFRNWTSSTFRPSAAIIGASSRQRPRGLNSVSQVTRVPPS